MSNDRMAQRKSRRRTTIVLALVALIMVGVPLAGIGLIYVAFQGGSETMALNHEPAPDQDKPEVVQKRAQARATAEAALVDLNSSQVITAGPASYSAHCERGQNNWKVHEGSRHDCSVTAAHFYTWTGTFPQFARQLNAELVAKGWTFDKYDGGLPQLAVQYEAGRNPYQNPTPGVPVVLDFSQSWSTCYEKGKQQRVCLEFADRNTDLAKQAGSFDFAQSRDLGDFYSYTETSQTVDSRSTITNLLQHADGVVFATSSEPYYSTRS
jgi:hypothetical protein